MPRQLLCLIILALFALPQTSSSDLAPEPGLTARLSELALLKMPAAAKDGLLPIESPLRERLQILPVVATDDPAGQIKLIFGQVKDNVASPELLASAARAVVALSLPKGESAEWEQFKNAVALRSQLGDVTLGSVEKTVDPAVLITALSGQANALKTEFVVASKSGDGSKLGDLRKRAATNIVQGISSIWSGLIAIQAPDKIASAKTTEKAAESVKDDPKSKSDQAASSDDAASAPTMDSPQAEPIVNNQPAPEFQRPSGPVHYIGHKTTKKFHQPNCQFLPAPANQVPLRSRIEAIRAGFTPCKVCKP